MDVTERLRAEEERQGRCSYAKPCGGTMELTAVDSAHGSQKPNHSDVMNARRARALASAPAAGAA